jgi:hypothetical protein
MDLHVDRLTLRLFGVSESDARRLAALIAQDLAAADAPTGVAPHGPLRVDVASQAGESIEDAARRIVAHLILALGRSS